MLLILALDGVPYTLLKRLIDGGRLPNLKQVITESGFRPMDSVLPPVSSSAWASFMTGHEPLDHGIMGFVDRNPSTMEWFVPSAKHLKKETLLRTLSENGRQVFSMNVPLTYPPEAVNGIIISGFLAPDPDRATYPAHLGKILKARGYRIDADVELAKQDGAAFLNQLEDIMAKRFEILFHYLDKRDWDLFMIHIMETDRLHHFFWKDMEEGTSLFAKRFYDFYQKLDRHIGLLMDRLPDEAELILLSDHGFTKLKREVQLNAFLHAGGYLSYKKHPPESLQDLDSRTIAYSLYPGRIYINRKDREREGSIAPGSEYDRIREELKLFFHELRDPETGEAIVERVITSQEWMPEQGNGSLLSGMNGYDFTLHAPDLFVLARRGFDLKGNLWHPVIFENTVHNGMHTYDDAFISIRGHEITEEDFSIKDVTPAVYQLLNETIPGDISKKRILRSDI
jgi:predicted AlkP superfamily phosphohydrolase/phosphomutase